MSGKNAKKIWQRKLFQKEEKNWNLEKDKLGTSDAQ